MAAALTILSVAAASPEPESPAAAICTPTGQAHQGGPVDEDYVVLGTRPHTGQVYSGTLSVHFSQDRYLLLRKVEGEIVRGEARSVVCGSDKVHLLQVEYASHPTATRFVCTVGTDDDNGSLVHRGRASSSGHSETGLEAWFSMPVNIPLSGFQGSHSPWDTAQAADLLLHTESEPSATWPSPPDKTN